jgi:hypothetical protein
LEPTLFKFFSLLRDEKTDDKTPKRKLLARRLNKYSKNLLTTRQKLDIITTIKSNKSTIERDRDEKHGRKNKYNMCQGGGFFRF